MALPNSTNSEDITVKLERIISNKKETCASNNLYDHLTHYAGSKSGELVDSNISEMVVNQHSDVNDDGVERHPNVKRSRTKSSSIHQYKALEKLITGMIVVVIIAMSLILCCLIPVIYFLGDTARVYRGNKHVPTVIRNDPFNMKAIEKLLHNISSTARMTKHENEELKRLVSTSKIFGYCTHNVPSTACLPCSCTPFNKLNNEYRCDCTNLVPKKDCRAYYENGFRTNGVYMIQPDGFTNITVFCDQTHDGGGWEVIQRRFDGSTGFYRNWNEYKLGFGDLHRDFYLGNKYISILTEVGKQLTINLMDYDYNNYAAKYNAFSVMKEASKFQLNCSGYNGGTADDYFCKYHSGKQFSSYDTDNDLNNLLSCSQSNQGGGGWWYSHCYESNLNGVYYQSRRKDNDAIKWFNIDGHYSLKRAEMKIRRSQ